MSGMRIGCCVNMVSADSHKIGYGQLATLDRLGYDYAELPLAQLMELDKGELDGVFSILSGLRISCESCNNFFPAYVRITGENADLNKAVDYAEKAADLAAKLGAKIIVFGSSGAKNVPEGFSRLRAYDQIVELLRAVSPILSSHGITAVIEPICHLESNIILTEADGIKLMRNVASESIKLLADFYHMSVENESPEILKVSGSDLRHVHFADPDGRVYPTENKPEFAEFFHTLRQIGYSGRVSVEAYSQDFVADAEKALNILKGLI